MERCFLPRTSAANHCGVARKRTSDSGIFEGVGWSVQGRQNFRSAKHWFRWDLSDVTNLIGEKHLRERFAGLGGEPAFAWMDAVLHGASPNAVISTLFGQAAGHCHIIGPLLQPNRHNYHAIVLEK
jgi:hypothetical protein